MEKYGERLGGDRGEEGFGMDVLLQQQPWEAGLSSSQKVYELYLCWAKITQIAQAGPRRGRESSSWARAHPERFLPERMNQARCWAYHDGFHEESHGIGPTPIMCRTPAASVKARSIRPLRSAAEAPGRAGGV